MLLKFAPYRDSVLTRLLKNSIGGDSKVFFPFVVFYFFQTFLIATISPSVSSKLQTKSTLRFAQRAKNIESKAIINEDSEAAQVLLKEEIQRLKTLNDDLGRQLLIKDAETQSLMKKNPSLIPLTEKECNYISDSINVEDVMDLRASESEAGIIQDEEMKIDPEENKNEITTYLPDSINNSQFYEERIKQLQKLLHSDRQIRVTQEEYFEKVMHTQTYQIQQ